MEWIKRLSNTDTSVITELLRQNAKLTDALIEANGKLTGALEHVVASKFDRPVFAATEAEATQGGHSFSVEHMSDALAIEDDREFLETVHGD